MYANFILNDIALVKLSTKVNMNNPLVSIANMAAPGADFEGNDCRLTGWGRMGGFGKKTPFNTLRPRQNGRHFADDTVNHIFVNENVRISIKFSLKFVPKGPINNIPALIPIMAWRRSGDKPLSEPMMVSLPTHICVTRPQWNKFNHTGNIDDVRCSRLHQSWRTQNRAIQTSKILLGKHAYFGLDFCINVFFNTLRVVQER